MKTILLCISIIITLATSSPSWASDLAKLYPEKIVEAKNLYPLAKAFFTGPGSLPPGETLTPEMLKSPERQAAYYKFRRLLGLAIDAEYDISYLEEFGLKKAKRGYYVDFSQYPQWATVESLFLKLKSVRDLNYASNDLTRLGFVESDIVRIRNYLEENHPYIRENIAEQKLLSTHIKKFPLRKVTKALDPNSLKQIVEIHENVKYLHFNNWNTWALELLNQLSQSKQRILISYLHENLGGMAIGRAPVSENYFNTFAKELVTGKAHENLNSGLAELKTRIAKEATK